MATLATAPSIETRLTSSANIIHKEEETVQKINIPSINLFVSASLYPSEVKPQLGLFVEKRFFHLREYLRKNETNLKYELYSPTPYFPFENEAFGSYANYAKTPHFDIRQGTAIRYIRYPHIPILGLYSDAYLLAKTLEPKLKKFITQSKENIILIAEYGFPDAYALAMLGKKYKLPVVFTARGSDIAYFSQTSMGQWLVENYEGYISGIICVSENMRKDVIQTGFNEKKTIVIGNGVDHNIFYPQDIRAEVIKDYKITTDKIIVSVGGLIHRKRHDLAIEAISGLENVTLLIAGSGEKEAELKNLAKEKNCEERVIFTGQQTQYELARLYNAADIFLLCSEYEGRANVLLEAASCGTPLLSSNVGGSDEIITSDKMGLIFKEYTSQAIKSYLEELLHNPRSRKFISEQMQEISWEKTAQKYAEFLGHFRTP